MTNVILLFYAGLFAAMFWILAGLVSRWDEDHHELDNLKKHLKDDDKKLKALQQDLDGLYQQLYKLRDFAELTKSEVNTAAENDEAAARAILNIKNDISKLSVKLHKLEGKEDNNE